VFQRQAKAILANTEALSRVLLAHLLADGSAAVYAAPARRVASGHSSRSRSEADED
jgi:hypothetical protein